MNQSTGALGLAAEALVVVDMQNLFVDLVADSAPQVFQAVNKCVADAAGQRKPVVYTRDYAPIDLPEGDPERRADLHPDLDLRGPVVDKGPGKLGYMSGFLLAPAQQDLGGGGVGQLAEELRRLRVTRVTVVGIAADVCVAATARDAVRLGYSATIPLSATAFVHAHPEGDSAAIAALRKAGVDVLE